MAVSIEDLGRKTNNEAAVVLAECLSQATSKILNNGKSPSRKVNELDNRGSHFYLAQYWAEALASQDRDKELQKRFAPIADSLKSKEKQIVDELNAAQGTPVDIGGYYHPSPEKLAKAMRPSAIFNDVIETL